ncbi:hypothetical protein Gpo141_00007675 [Globisporangium polare]
MTHPSAIAPTEATKTFTKTVASSMKCSYRSKPCNSVRATKLNGDIHKLCEYHRRRANLNQQRVHQRRKLRECGDISSAKQQTMQMDWSASSSSPSSVSTPSWSWMSFVDSEKLCNDEDLLGAFELDAELDVEPSRQPCGDLPLPDLQLLQLLLSDNACNVPMRGIPQPECSFEFLDLSIHGA